MGRLLFLCPEKKGGKAFSPFFARREAGDLGRALARQKKSPLRLALRPLRGARLRPFGGGTHCPLEKNAPDRPGFAPPKKAPRSAPLRAVFLRLKAPFSRAPEEQEGGAGVRADVIFGQPLGIRCGEGGIAMGSVKAALFCHAQWMPGSVEMEEELARQLELLEEHCRSHDIEVVARYFHVGEAGLSPKGSVARELLRAAKRGDFEWIVVESFEAFPAVAPGGKPRTKGALPPLCLYSVTEGRRKVLGKE